MVSLQAHVLLHRLYSGQRRRLFSLMVSGGLLAGMD